ncbi:MAG TPA: hypothetical protein VJZ04_11080 [Lachnospiraceae bacterium]|nr:hypothetical protein [Lachnospiraceae bacterium]
MMYMHYCNCCHRIHMLNGHKMTCPKCENPLSELRVSYLDFVHMDIDQRAELKLKCANHELLKELATTYRMYKYSKWYRKLTEENIVIKNDFLVTDTENSDDNGTKDNNGTEKNND